MSIITKTGDDGTTALMFGRRVPKTHPQVEAYGTVDELNAALGVARAASRDKTAADHLLGIQKELIILMGELAVLPEDRERYQQQGYKFVTAAMAERLERSAKEIESQGLKLDDWAMPGANIAAAVLDVARTVCRRAERRVAALGDAHGKTNPELLRYLNRLSDLLWLMARREESSQ